MPKALQSFKAGMRVAIIGASGGIGKALTKRLSSDDTVKKIYAFSRTAIKNLPEKATHHPIDITDEASIEKAASLCDGPLDLVIITTGMLQEEPNLPEKSLRDIDLEAMQRCFAVNTCGPALIAKHFLPLLPKDSRSMMAFLSARVGSISDNNIGGWYSYRASKTALNMIIKNAAIETERRYKKAVIIGLHPGTVDTALSQPFQSNVQHEIFSPDKAADYLLNVMNERTPKDTGKCFAWDGQEIVP